MKLNRISVLSYFLFSNRNGVSFQELINYFFAPSYSLKAKAKIEKIEEDYLLNRIYIKGYTMPLFYPKSINVNSLYQVIVESLYPNNWHYYEIPQTSVNKNDIVVDCGAAEGLFSFLISQRCKKVYLIEPLPDFIRCLKKTFRTHDNVMILPVAISDIETIANISVNGISSNLIINGDGLDCKVTTLDKLFFELGIPVSYIKIDLEGYDYKAIKGAEKLIKKNKPKIAITTYHNLEHALQIQNYLKSIVPEYNILFKGIFQGTGSPVMLHAWI